MMSFFSGKDGGVHESHFFANHFVTILRQDYTTYKSRLSDTFGV